MFRKLIAILPLLFPPTVLAGPAGLVTVVGADPVPLQLMLPASSPFMLQYDSASLAVWDTVSRDNAIPSGASEVAPDLAGDLETDCDRDLRDIGMFSPCYTGADAGPPNPGCSVADFDSDGDVDFGDFVVVQGSLTGPGGDCPQLPVTVYVEGLLVSEALGDRVIQLSVDPDGDGVFELLASKAVTNTVIQASPTFGTWGTPISVTLQPAVAPLAFDATTTATWTGKYVPDIGPASEQFGFFFDGQQVRDGSASAATLLAGDGSLSGSLPSPQLLATTSGSLEGELLLSLASGQIELRRAFSFVPTIQLRFLELVDDPNSPDDPPAYGDELAEIESVIVDDPANPPFLTGVRHAHFAIEICVADDPETVDASPGTIDATVITIDAAGVVVDSVEGVPFDRSSATLPGCQLYRTIPELPVVLVSEPLDKQLFPTLVILHAVDGGAIVAIPGGGT